MRKPRAISRRGKDVMGYQRKEGLKDYTDDDIVAAKVMAKEEGYRWDCVLTDPKVTGNRFLKRAKMTREALMKRGWKGPEYE